MFYFRCWGIYAFTYVPYSTVEVMHLLLYSFMCFSYSQEVYCVYPLSRSSRPSKLFGFLPFLRNIDRVILILANA